MHGIRNVTRKEQILKRKNFFPSIIVILILWGLLVGFIYFVDPDSFAAVYVFFSLFFVASLFTFSIILGNARRGILGSTGLVLFLVLRYLGVGNILNFLLIAGVLIVTELYFAKRV